MFDLGFVKDLLTKAGRTTEGPQAYYEVPVPPAAGTDLMVTFYDKDTMRLRTGVNWFVSGRVVRVTLPPAIRVELRLAWLADEHLDGFRCVLGPASKFRTRVVDPQAMEEGV